jgi:MobA/MobL family
MAQYHLSGHAIITRKSGQKVVRSAAYASGERLRDDRYGDVHDFTRRRHVLYNAMTAPEHAPDWARDRENFWNAVEKKERRKDSQLAIPYDIALPYELTLDQNIALAREYVKNEFTDRGLVADIAIHRPDPRKDPRNIHLHILIPTRPIDEDGLGPKPSTSKSKAEWEQERTDNILRLRKSWADHHNRHMAAAGFADLTIDHRSLEEQGIEREPTTHRGVASDHMEQRGIKTDRGDNYRDIQAENEKRALRKRKRKDYAGAPEAAPMPDSGSPADKILADARAKEQERQDQARKQEEDRQEQARKQEEDRQEHARKEQERQYQAGKEQQDREEEARVAETKRRDELGKAYRERIEAICLAAQQRETQLADPDRHREYIIAYQAEQKLDAMRAREEAHRAQLTEQAKSVGAPIQSAQSRYSEALAQNYDANNPWPSLAKAALQEHAMFRRDQDNLEKQIHEATDPLLRKGLVLRQAIEGYEYLAMTGERIAKMSEIVSGKLVNGRLVSEESTRMRALIHHEENGYLARAEALRKEFRLLQKQRDMPAPAPAQEKSRRPTRERRPRQPSKYAKMVEETNDPEAARKRKEQEEKERQKGLGRGKDERER